MELCGGVCEDCEDCSGQRSCWDSAAQTWSCVLRGDRRTGREVAWVMGLARAVVVLYSSMDVMAVRAVFRRQSH